MKCPYRKIIMPTEQFGLKGTEEQFAVCYGTECPFYVPEQTFSGGLYTTETCARIKNE